jgi:hypothetical protein
VPSFNPHAAQTARGHDERIGVSSGSQSAFMTALCLHQPELQVDEKSPAAVAADMSERDWPETGVAVMLASVLLQLI